MMQILTSSHYSVAQSLSLPHMYCVEQWNTNSSLSFHVHNMSQ